MLGRSDMKCSTHPTYLHTLVHTLVGLATCILCLGTTHSELLSVVGLRFIIPKFRLKLATNSYCSQIVKEEGNHEDIGLR